MDCYRLSEESVDSQGYSSQVAEGRNILVLVNRIQQIDVFEKLLKEKEVDDCYIISGKTKVRERERVYWRR